VCLMWLKPIHRALRVLIVMALLWYYRPSFSCFHRIPSSGALNLAGEMTDSISGQGYLTLSIKLEKDNLQKLIKTEGKAIRILRKQRKTIKTDKLSQRIDCLSSDKFTQQLNLKVAIDRKKLALLEHEKQCKQMEYNIHRSKSYSGLWSKTLWKMKLHKLHQQNSTLERKITELNRRIQHLECKLTVDTSNKVNQEKIATNPNGMNQLDSMNSECNERPGSPPIFKMACELPLCLHQMLPTKLHSIVEETAEELIEYEEEIHCDESHMRSAYSMDYLTQSDSIDWMDESNCYLSITASI